MTIADRNRIVAVLTGNENDRTISNAFKKAGWIELRLDCFIKNFPEKNFVKWAKKIRESTDANIIATVRWHRESQDPSFFIPDDRRIEIYQSISNYADYFDVELKSRIVRPVYEIAKKNRKKLILSYHNFKSTPNRNKLLKICDLAKINNADIVKIATFVKKEIDLLNLISVLVSEKKRIDIAVIPMGKGTFERLIPLAFGGIFTYFAAEEKTAPSQPSMLETESWFS